MIKEVELTDNGLEALLGTSCVRVARFTNQHGIRFYITRHVEFQTTTNGHHPEKYLNFYGFFKHYDDCNRLQVSMTIGVRENYAVCHRLNDDEILLLFLQEYGLVEFRKFLNGITAYEAADETIILKLGDDRIRPIVKNDRLVVPTLVDDDERLTRIAERAFCQAILENNGRRPLDQLDIVDACFVPTEILSVVEARFVSDEYVIDKRNGILNKKGEHHFRRIADMREDGPVDSGNLLQAIQSGESGQLEFKSSLRWDIEKGMVNTSLEDAILKTIAAFANSDGGTLLIGVSDSGEVLGIERDLESFKSKGNIDLFERCLVQMLINCFGQPTAPRIAKVKFEAVGDRHVCVVHVPPGDSPVFIVKGGAERFRKRARLRATVVSGSSDRGESCDWARVPINGFRPTSHLDIDITTGLPEVEQWQNPSRISKSWPCDARQTRPGTTSLRQSSVTEPVPTARA